MRSKVAVDEKARDSNIKTIMALCTLRSASVKIFFRLALEDMSDQQLAILIQKMGEWIAENPPAKSE